MNYTDRQDNPQNFNTVQINLEATEPNTIQAYSDLGIQINSITYEKSLIVSREEIISDSLIKTVQDIDLDFIQLLMSLKPEVIIIGHGQTGTFPPMEIISYLSQHGIGVECMSTGAACRTWNVLLNEHRAVVAVFIFPDPIINIL